MKVRTLILASVILALPSATFAVELDCKWVALELEAGRTPREVITMMSSLHPGLQDSDVEACATEAKAWQSRTHDNVSFPSSPGAIGGPPVVR